MSSGTVKSRRTLVLFGFALVILAFAVALLFGAIIFQEGNPFPVVQALARIELGGADVARISGPAVKYIQKVGPEEPLSEHLSGCGWAFRERLGAAIFYDRDGSTLTAEARMLTRRYVVYELDREPCSHE